MILDFNVSFLGVLVAAVAGMVLGFLWFGPIFGKLWIKLTKMSQKDIEAAKKKGMGKSYFTAFVIVFIFSWVLAIFQKTLGAADISSALLVAFFLWLGFIATIQLNGVLWQSQPVGLYLLNVIHYLVILEIQAIILVLI